MRIARGKPARDGEIKHDVPSAGRVFVFVAFVAELDGRPRRDKLLGDGTETGSGIARFLRDKLSLSLKGDHERPEKDADGTASFEQRARKS